MKILKKARQWLPLTVAVLALILVVAVPTTVEAATPGKPKNLKGVVYHDKVDLKWEAPSRFPAGSKYRVFQRTVGEQNWQQVKDALSATQWTHENNPDDQKKFLYRVAAYNGSDQGRFSNNFKAIVPDSAILNPERWKSHSLKAYDYGRDGVKLKWQIRSTLGVTGYTIERRVISETAVTTFTKALPVETTNCTDPGDPNCLGYYDPNDEPFYFDNTALRDVKYAYRVKVNFDYNGSNGEGSGSSGRRIKQR